ncbi:MAG: CBS and ACT domain-containing protein [Desulfatiglans sp.]|nr:CBS and ACT domain-containing protein [Thermodesulfobacteriota bacterium]MEE4351786.1 CBS and ACT domain-containing protein [Desulfatiglans sp.]
MLVKNWMSKKVVTADVDDSMQEATKLLKEHNIRMLPVMKKNKLVGIVTDRDIKEASASDATTLEIHELLYLVSKIRVKEIMTKDPVTVSPDLTIEETAQILLDKKISGVPVMDQKGKIVGTITQTDIFKALISLTGLAKRGIQFAFELEDRPGSIKDVADIIRKFGGRMASILSSYDGAPTGRRNVYIRMYDIDRSRLDQLIKELKGKAKVIYMVDHKENRREIYE